MLSRQTLNQFSFSKFALKSTYSNVEFQTFSVATTRPRLQLIHNYVITTFKVLCLQLALYYLFATVYMSQLNTRNDRKQAKNSAKVGVSNVKISSASGGFAPDPLTRGFASGPHLDASYASPAIFGQPVTSIIIPKS